MADDDFMDEVEESTKGKQDTSFVNTETDKDILDSVTAFVSDIDNGKQCHLDVAISLAKHLEAYIPSLIGFVLYFFLIVKPWSVSCWKSSRLQDFSKRNCRWIPFHKFSRSTQGCFTVRKMLVMISKKSVIICSAWVFTLVAISKYPSICSTITRFNLHLPRCSCK